MGILAAFAGIFKIGKGIFHCIHENHVVRDDEGLTGNPKRFAIESQLGSCE